jgi:hypothetical protein
MPLPATAVKAVSEHAEAIHGLLARAAGNVVQIGLRLQAVRDIVGRSQFQPWLKREFRWSQPVASNYMRAARAFSELDCLGQFQPSAMFILARKRCPPAARQEAIRLARRGERVTKARAAELVGQHSPAASLPGLSERMRRSLLKSLPSLSAKQLEELAAEILEMARRMKAETPDG